MQTLLLTALALISSASADHRGFRPDGIGAGIIIGTRDFVDCAKHPNGTRVFCDPYKRQRTIDDPFSPARALRKVLQPYETAECLSDRAGGLIMSCEVPQGWVDPYPPTPAPRPEPQPRPLTPEEQYLLQTHNEVASLLGLIANAVGGEKGPRIAAGSLLEIQVVSEYFRNELSRLVFVAPASCQQGCSALEQAIESTSQVAEAFRTTHAGMFSAMELAQLKGHASRAYQHTNNASAAPELEAKDVCGRLMFAEGPGGNLFRVTSFGIRTVIANANRFGANLRAEFLKSNGTVASQAEGTCNRQGPERKDLWIITLPYQGQELRISLEQVNPESKALRISATMNGQPIKIRH